MEMDLVGIKNQNEYYTNHYFTSIFKDNADETISAWKAREKEEGITLPWHQFRDTSRQYYRIRDRYKYSKNEEQSKPYVQEMAELYLNAMGYTCRQSVMAQVADNLTVPVFHEEVRSNGAPLLWAFVCVAGERDEDILQSYIYGSSYEEEEYGQTVDICNDDILAKLFFAGEEAPRFIILIGINQIALIDRNKWSEKRFLQFNLEDIFSRHSDSTFMAMTVLLHRESLCPSDGGCVLDNLDENSHKHSAGVSEALKYALRECIEILGNEVIYDMSTRQGINLDENPVDASELTLECLRYMYRFLFMLFIEARPELGYAPMKSQVYVQGYSLEGIRDVCARVKDANETVSEGYYICDTISELFDMIYMGYPGDLDAYKRAFEDKSLHDMFTIEALKAHIFDPEYTKLITNARLRNSAMLQIVDLMSISRPSGSKERRGRISYSALGINQMGAVYEALLSYRGFIAEETLFEVKRAGEKFNELDVGYFIPERELDNYKEEERVRVNEKDPKSALRKYEKGTFIYRLAGREREKSASYYTPEVLTKCLVKYALKELLEGKTADEILHLTICEPAMGSAAFLNEAINQLADAYLNKKQEELGQTIEYDKRFEELQKVKMFIADRNVYGVDLNPIAVELAEVSLWLNTIYKGAYVPWFGTQLVCGNSLIGARRQVYYTSKLERGKWFEEAPVRVMPGEKRKRTGVASRVYHFLLGDPGMANYTDKVIKSLEPDNIKAIKEWQKEFTKKYDEDEIQTLLRLSDVIDTLWDRTIELRKSVERATSEPLSVYGHDESQIEGSHKTIREKDEIYHRIFKSEHMNNAGPYARLKAAMDYWCALWFWPIDKADLLPTRQEFFLDMDLILEGGIQNVSVGNNGQMSLFDDKGNVNYDAEGNFQYSIEGTQLAIDFSSQFMGLGEVNLDHLRSQQFNPLSWERLAIANQIAEEQKFHHWELEFADIFFDKGGFDLIVGNPPWIRNEWKLSDVIADVNPLVDIRKGYEYDEIECLKNNRSLRITAIHQYEQITSIQNYNSAKTNYALLDKQPGNLYKLFAVNSWWWMNECGCVGLVHPEGLYDNPYGEKLRKILYPKLRYHFEFINEKYLFKDVAHTKRFSINISSNIISESFITITNLFETKTIDECFLDEPLYPLMGIKDDNNEWNIYGHPDRKIVVTDEILNIVGEVFDGKQTLGARMPELHASSYLHVYEKISEQKKFIRDVKGFWCNQFYNETSAKKEKLIIEDTDLIDEASKLVFLGPNIWVGNPYNKSARIPCIEKSDYDAVDLDYVALHPEYLPNTKYTATPGLIKYAPNFDNGMSYANAYKILARRRLNLSMERSLVSAIVPRKSLHVHSVLGIYVDDFKTLLTIAGCLNSIIYDFYIKTFGKEDLYENTLGNLPVPQGDLNRYLWARVLMLNAIGNEFQDLVKKVIPYIDSDDSWARKDNRLANDTFCSLLKEKRFSSSEYERRELLAEIDVLVALMLGISLKDLQGIYKLQFPVMNQYEGDTWYDSNGKIVYTNNKSLFSLSRKEWELHKDDSVIAVETIDFTGNETVTKYVAPFTRADRLVDYEEIWNYFSMRQ